MARRKGMVTFDADLAELHTAVGALQGMALTVRTDRFITPLVEATHRDLANTFDMHMDLLANQDPKQYHHVYEWTHKGPGGRLWFHELKGRGATNRVATWGWKPSKTPIPSPQERAQDRDDPMSLVPGDKIELFSTRKYIFIWKAPVMEYNKSVNITPRYANKIAFATGDVERPLMFVDASTIDNPGGEKTTGAFTEAWVTWWGTVAPTLIESSLEQEAKRGIENATIAAFKKGPRNAKVGISTLSQEAAEAHGRRWAAANLHKFARSYEASKDWREPEG